MTHWTADAGHVFVLGRTQTGKTTLAREIHAENDRVSIWVNETGDDRVGNVAGTRVRSIEGLESAMSRNEYKINWLSSNRERDIQRLQSWAWEKAELSDRNFRMQIVLDELHRAAPQSQSTELQPRDAVRRLAKEGMKRNVKIVGITQDPVAMDKQTLRQREYLAVYGLSAEQSRYISDYGVDPSRVNAQDEYAGIVYHASGEVVTEGVKAQEKYA